MTASQILQIYPHTIMAYLGTDDPAAVERHSQAMGLIMLFVAPLLFMKSRDSNNMSPEMVQGALQVMMPKFRAMQPQIVQVVAGYR